MKTTNLTLIVALAVSLPLSAQFNVKNLKDKATKTATPTASSSSSSSSSSGSVFEVKKVDMTKLEEKPNGSIKGAAQFYGAGYVIMNNMTGMVLSSADGLNWKEEYKAPSTPINGVAYGEGKIVAVGGAKAFVTTDGKTWNSFENATNGVLNGDYQAVAYGAGMFVAVGKTATLTFSKDGETWVQYFGEELDPEYRPGDTHFYGVSFANGKFYVVGNSNRVISLIPDPKDGLKKEKCTVLGRVTDRLNDVAYDGKNIVAVGTKDDYSSADGLTWNVTNPEWQIWGIHYAKGLFVKACGFGRIFTSPDGADNSWKEAFNYPRTLYWDAAYGNNMWLVTGKDGSMVTSKDGVKWDYHSIKPLYTVKSVIFVE